MTEPSRPTVKRLFAVSGNRCAFPKCTTPVVYPGTESIVCEICHIKGEKPTAPRYDAAQTDDERHGFENLILLCSVHHKVIDDDEQAYTIERLTRLKQEHEARHQGGVELPDKVADGLVANFKAVLLHGSVILATGQTGGQTAHSITNVSLAQPAAQESRLGNELRARNLDDPDSATFCSTRYSQRVRIADTLGRASAPSTLGIFFAVTPGNLYSGAKAEGELAGWMDCNKRRYEPFPAHLFVPGTSPDQIGKALVWHDGERHRFTGPGWYMQYLALEPDGYVEYGFYPGAWADSETDRVYYARVVAGFVAFLYFVRDLCRHAGQNPDAASVGFALTGAEGKNLLRIDKHVMAHFQRTAPPSRNGLLYQRQATQDAAWSVDEVAREMARELLELWQYSAPGGFSTPEFNGDRYEGAYFKEIFRSF